MAWRLQFVTALTGYKLNEYIEGTIIIPLKHLPKQTTVNHAYDTWHRQDQLILNAIVASCSEEVVSHIQSAVTSAEAWSLLEDIFANQSRSRIMSLKEQIISTTKDSRSMADYIKLMKSYYDELMMTSDPMKEGDFLLHVLNGAGQDYENTVVALRVRDKPLTFGDVRDTLLDHEFLVKKRELLTESSVITTNFTKKRHGSFFNRKVSPPGSFTPTVQSQRPDFKPNMHRGPVWCQYYNKRGHTARRCWFLTK